MNTFASIKPCYQTVLFNTYMPLTHECIDFFIHFYLKLLLLTSPSPKFSKVLLLFSHPFLCHLSQNRNKNKQTKPQQAKYFHRNDMKQKVPCTHKNKLWVFFCVVEKVLCCGLTVGCC